MNPATHRPRQRDRRSRAVGLLLLIGGMAAVSACQADFEVTVTVEEDGSGIVETVTTLDAEASAAVLDLGLGADGLPLSDLLQSGWDVSAPERGADGSTIVTASKEFGTTRQFSDVMTELTGEDGVIRNFRLFRTKTFARVDYRVVGTVDTTDGLDSFADPDLTRALGRPVSEIAAAYDANEEDVAVALEVILPGDIQGEAPPEVVDTEESLTKARWDLLLSEPEVTDIELSSATREVSALVLRGVAVVAGVLAGLVAFAQLLRILLPDRRRRPSRSRTPRSRSAEQPEAKETPPNDPVAEADAEPVVPADQEASATYKVVALDGLGVLYQRGGTVSSVLIPFARERASSATDEDILAKARLLELGRITTGEFWASIGVDGEAAALDADYLAQLSLTPGVIRYLRSLRDRGIRAACITNDANEWAAKLRAGNSLEALVDPWVISGAVGVRKPDKPIFEVLRRVTGEEPSAILIVDDDLDVLDAARAEGYATLWFTAEGTKDDARGHPLIRNFDVDADRLADADSSAPSS